MSKARDEYYNYINYIHKDSHITNYVKELEAEKAELVELLSDINRRIKSGAFNIPMYENYYMVDVEHLLTNTKTKNNLTL